MFLLVGVEWVVYCCWDRYEKRTSLSTTTRKKCGYFNCVDRFFAEKDLLTKILNFLVFKISFLTAKPCEKPNDVVHLYIL